MENNNDNNDNNDNTIKNNDVTTQTEIKAKKPITEGHRKAIKAYYEKHKNTDEYKQKNREHAKKQYQKDKQKVITRVRLYQKRIQDIEQLERLNELKEQGLISYTLNAHEQKELLENLEILGL